VTPGTDSGTNSYGVGGAAPLGGIGWEYWPNVVGRNCLGPPVIFTGSDSPIVTGLPWLLLTVAVVGVGYAYWMRSAHSCWYAELARDAEHGEGRPRCRSPVSDDAAAGHCRRCRTLLTVGATRPLPHIRY